MSFDEARRIIIIVAICIGVLVALAILAMIIRCCRRARVSADFKAQTKTNAQAQDEERRRQFAVNQGDVEYGIDTRAEAQATSYYGGMADVTHFGGSRQVHPEPPQAPVKPIKNNDVVSQTSGRYPGESHQAKPLQQPERSYHPITPRVTSVPGNSSGLQRQQGGVYDSGPELARKEEDVPPAYSAVASHP